MARCVNRLGALCIAYCKTHPRHWGKGERGSRRAYGNGTAARRLPKCPSSTSSSRRQEYRETCVFAFVENPRCVCVFVRAWGFGAWVLGSESFRLGALRLWAKGPKGFGALALWRFGQSSPAIRDLDILTRTPATWRMWMRISRN